MADSQGEKTEKPSFKKLKDARKRGEIPRSRDLTVAISTIVITMALGGLGPGIVSRLGSRLVTELQRVGDRPLQPVTSADLSTLIVTDATQLAYAVGPLMLLAAVTGLLANTVQSGWNVAPEAMQFHWERLSPAHGARRLLPKQSGIDLLKIIIAVSAMTTIAYGLCAEVIADGPSFAWMSPAASAEAGWSRVMRLLWQTATVGLAIGVADYGVQYWRHYSNLKMTKQEVRDEAKQSEGSPEMKGHARKKQRDMTKRRMLKAIKEATVVVTNPTHFAVALQYHRDRMVAPVVVAKGADHLAARIKAIARDHGVPTVENVSLAQALYKGTEIGDVIPASLFGAVAEVLAYLVRIKQLML